MKAPKSKFSSEAMLCLTFVRQLPEGWTAYQEWAEQDILLVRSDGLQIGIEAKLSLNAKVIAQAVESDGSWHATGPATDHRAVLVPYGASQEMKSLCRLIGITVIEQMDKATFAVQDSWQRSRGAFTPLLPKNDETYWGIHSDWWDWAPAKRIELPEYVPDVVAGNSAPVRLTPWKIKALKMVALVEDRGFVTRADFKALNLDHRRWLEPWCGWLTHSEKRGVYVAGPRIGDFKAQHPKNYEQIKADIEKWRPKVDP